MYKLIAFITNIVLSITRSKAHVYEQQHVPKKGSYIVACTHTGYVDILNLGLSLMPKEIHFMAKKQLFDIKGLGWLITKLHAFPVDRENPGPSVVKIPSQLLKEGHIVGIFPSGTRSTEGSNLKQGAITIAQLTKVPILPAAYIGPKNIKDLFTKEKGYLIYGEPFYVTAKGKEGREEFTQRLEHELEKLTEEVKRRSGIN